MKCDNLKIGQKVFFVSAEYKLPAEEVVITQINKNDTLSIKKNDEIISFELVKDDSEFIFAINEEGENFKNYGFLYLSLDLIEQDNKFYDILQRSSDKTDSLNVEDKIKLINFLDELLKK